MIENIDHGPGFAQRSLVIATNMYRRAEDGWRMIAHHASPGTVAPIEAVNAGDGQVLH